MFKDLVGEKVTLIISTRADNILEYTGTVLSETESSVLLSNVTISFMMLNFQKGIFGNNMNIYKENIDKVVLNKRYIISCNK
ncbi:MAG: hypothetical protein J5634_01190 [Bacilli bacterium]|nr:hypothetical protein [Bacilli bacterium]